MKSNENICVHCTFERLEHQKSQDVPIEIHQNACLQSKQAFAHFKSHKISKSDPKWSPEGDQNSIKDNEKSILGPSRAPLSASLFNLITRMLPKDPHMTENGHLVTNSGVYPEIVRGSKSLQTLHIFNPSLTSGCNHRGGRRQGRSLRIYI